MGCIISEKESSENLISKIISLIFFSVLLRTISVSDLF